MSTPTVYGTARFGAVDDTAVTGLHIASLSANGSTEQARGKTSTGFSVALAIFEDTAEITASGVVVTSGTVPGLNKDLGDVLVLANGAATTMVNMLSTPHTNAGTVITSSTLERSNSDFETGSLGLIYLPLVDLGA